MVEVNRRGFLVGAGVSAGLVFAEEEKVFDGGFAPVTPPGVPARKSPVLPPGAVGLDAFRLRCVGCLLCVQQCPSHVLRASRGARSLLQPEMGFENGYCRPECTTCGEVCPAGAIRPVTVERKRNIHLGHAVWHRDRCLAATDGVSCDACVRHCPVQAIYQVPTSETDKTAPKVPAIDKMKCIGCGACEHLCPARPLPAMTVKGFEVHREVKPMGDEDILTEARRLFETNRAAVVVVKGGMICASGKGRGLSPLLNLCDRAPADVKDAWVIDKVIGKAAAAICVSFGAKRVHAALMCEPAQALLKEHGVAFSADKVVPQILNRDQSGLCPLEQSVKDLTEIPAMLKAIRAKIRQLRKAAAAKAK
ncbi:MAG: DUF1893 domain-containing protein [Kiritimatiellia bacterium]